MNAVTPRALPSAAPSRYVSAAAARPETGTLGMPTQQQILNQQINLASTNASPATMQTLLNNPRFEQMLRDPQQARMLHDNPAFKAILPKLKEEADRLPTTGTGPDGNPINPRQTMTTALNEFANNAPIPTPSPLTPPLGPSQPTAPSPTAPPRSAQLARPSI